MRNTIKHLSVYMKNFLKSEFPFMKSLLIQKVLKRKSFNKEIFRFEETAANP